MDNAGSSPVRGAKGTYTEYMAEYLKARYRRRMNEAIARLGGKCAYCGSESNLEFDHIDRDTKVSTISRLWSARAEVFEAEIDKCQLLCNACHLGKSALELSVNHGEGASGKKNCNCDPCKTKKREYMASKDYNSNNRCRRINCACDKRHYPVSRRSEAINIS